MARNYHSARGILIYFGLFLSCIFVLLVFCVVLDCLQYNTLMLKFKSFWPKICCNYYNISNFISVIHHKNSVVNYTTLRYLFRPCELHHPC